MIFLYFFICHLLTSIFASDMCFAGRKMNPYMVLVKETLDKSWEIIKVNSDIRSQIECTSLCNQKDDCKAVSFINEDCFLLKIGLLHMKNVLSLDTTAYDQMSSIFWQCYENHNKECIFDEFCHDDCIDKTSYSCSCIKPFYGPNCQYGTTRLDGSTNCSLVEFYNGKDWGLVCHAEEDINNVGQVICYEFGFSGVESITKVASVKEISLMSPQCNGTEKLLAECSEGQDCDNSKIVQLQCKQEKRNRFEIIQTFQSTHSTDAEHITWNGTNILILTSSLFANTSYYNENKNKWQIRYQCGTLDIYKETRYNQYELKQQLMACDSKDIVLFGSREHLFLVYPNKVNFDQNMTHPWEPESMIQPVYRYDTKSEIFKIHQSDITLKGAKHICMIKTSKNEIFAFYPISFNGTTYYDLKSPLYKWDHVALKFTDRFDINVQNGIECTFFERNHTIYLYIIQHTAKDEGIEEGVHTNDYSQKDALWKQTDSNIWEFVSEVDYTGNGTATTATVLHNGITYVAVGFSKQLKGCNVYKFDDGNQTLKFHQFIDDRNAGTRGYDFVTFGSDLYLMTMNGAYDKTSYMLQLNSHTGLFEKFLDVTIGQYGHTRMSPFIKRDELYFILTNRFNSYQPLHPISETYWERFSNTTSYLVKWI